MDQQNGQGVIRQGNERLDKCGESESMDKTEDPKMGKKHAEKKSEAE